jgi:hypothetical protein
MQTRFGKFCVVIALSITALRFRVVAASETDARSPQAGDAIENSLGIRLAYIPPGSSSIRTDG